MRRWRFAVLFATALTATLWFTRDVAVVRDTAQMVKTQAARPFVAVSHALFGAPPARSRTSRWIASTDVPAPRTSRVGDQDTETDLFEMEHEVCDFGKVKLDRKKRFMPAVLVDSAVAALTRAAQEVQVSGTEADRALGLYALAAIAGDIASQSDTSPLQACGDDDACAQRHRQGVQTPMATTLAEMARTTRNPTVYAAALRLCGGSVITACQALTPQRWAELDGGNAVAWLAVASTVAQRKDMAARDDAMRRAAAAANFDLRMPPMLSLLHGDAAATQSALTRAMMDAMLLTTAISYSAMTLDYSTIGQYCAKEEVVQPTRRQECSQLADLLATKDPTLSGVALGAVFGERSGWPAERLAALRDEKDAGVAALLGSEELLAPFSCSGRQVLHEWTRDFAQYGERETIKRYIASTGRTIAELAQQSRAQSAAAAAKQQPNESGSRERR